MTYEILWEPGPIDVAAGHLQSDPAGLQAVFAAIDQLSDDPRPTDTSEFGSPDRRRLRVGTYSIVYEIHDDMLTVLVLYLGRR